MSTFYFSMFDVACGMVTVVCFTESTPLVTIASTTEPGESNLCACRFVWLVVLV